MLLLKQLAESYQEMTSFSVALDIKNNVQAHFIPAEIKLTKGVDCVTSDVNSMFVPSKSIENKEAVKNQAGYNGTVANCQETESNHIAISLWVIFNVCF